MAILIGDDTDLTLLLDKPKKKTRKVAPLRSGGSHGSRKIKRDTPWSEIESYFASPPL